MTDVRKRPSHNTGTDEVRTLLSLARLLVSLLLWREGERAHLGALLREEAPPERIVGHYKRRSGGYKPRPDRGSLVPFSTSNALLVRPVCQRCRVRVSGGGRQ